MLGAAGLAAVAVAAPVRPQSDTPQRLLARIIRYEATVANGPDDAEYRSFFAKALRTAIDRDAAGPDIGYLNGDVFCSCQESTGRTRVVALRMNGARAVATIESEIALEKPRRVVLRLVKEGDRWAVADIGDEQELSLLRALRRSR